VNRLNILIIPPHDLLAHPTPSWLYHIGNILANRHNVSLLSYPGHPLAHQKPVRSMNSGRVIFNPIRTNNLALYYLANSANIWAALSRFFDERRVDVIINANILPSYAALKIGRRYGVRSIFDYHDHIPEGAAAYFTNPFLSGIVQRVVFDVVRRNIMMSDYVATNSRTLKDFIQRTVGVREDRIRAIPNGVNTNLFYPSSKEKARKALGLEGHDFVLLYCGSMDAWVDLELLIRLVDYLRTSYGRVLLLMVGLSHNSSVQASLEQLIQKHKLHENVMLIPPQPHERVPEFVNAADAVIAPYKNVLKNYVVPLKILESLACARPVITANIREYKAWFGGMPVIYYNTEEELRRETIGLIKSYEDWKTELLRTSQQIRSRFSWEESAAQYEEVLKGFS